MRPQLQLQEMQDLILARILEDATANGTAMPLGRDFKLNPAELPGVHFRLGGDELEHVLAAIADKLRDAGVRAEAQWSGSREDGTTVIHVVHL